ncbi:MAG: 16S rRNA (cytidine(1402)-2'-O)-methyltransferase [Alphaproteobacteria bacterium]|nr:16S rRNA (cytidine(1402)-2'-O)-methyltransferase [Alphaproteobacteria bacterium]
MTSPILLKPGLYIVPTPIGNLKDITLRSIETLNSVDIIACEDTRISGKLLNHYGISKKLILYHEHNGERMRPRILSMIEEGQSIALISDAGTPLISDPGFKLVREVHARGLYLTSLPGPSSVMTALTLSGFPTDHFIFAGFANTKDFDALSKIPYTLIFFSTANKLMGDLGRMQEVFSNRDVAVLREISKMFEEVRRGTFVAVMEHFNDHPPRGEIVLVLSTPTAPEEIDWQAIDKVIESALAKVNPMTSKDLAADLAEQFSIPKRDLYKRILSLK